MRLHVALHVHIHAKLQLPQLCYFLRILLHLSLPFSLPDRNDQKENRERIQPEHHKYHYLSATSLPVIPLFRGSWLYFVNFPLRVEETKKLIPTKIKEIIIIDPIVFLE